MDISSIVVDPPTQKELASRTSDEKIWSEFNFFYETGEPHHFELENGTKITFGSNPKEPGWNLFVNHDIILSSSNAQEIVVKVLELSK